MEDLELSKLHKEALEAIDSIDLLEKVNIVRNDYLSKKSKFMGLMSKMKDLSLCNHNNDDEYETIFFDIYCCFRIGGCFVSTETLACM